MPIILPPYRNAQNSGTDGPPVKTKMLIRFDETPVKDAANQSRTFTSTGPLLSTTQKKHGAQSLYTSENGRFLTPDAPELRLAGEYTIDFWVYLTALTNNTWLIAKNTQGVYNCLKTYNGSLHLQTGTTSGIIEFNGIMLTNRWQHYAIVHSGNRTYLFIDGMKQMDFEDTSGFGVNTAPLAIGSTATNEPSFSNGYYDEVRISHVARWTENFTPPAEPLIVD